MSEPIRDWFWSSTTVEVATALAAVAPRTVLVAADVSRGLGRQDPRAIRGLLDRLHNGGLVARARLSTGKQGRPPWAYSLSDEQHAIAQRAAETPPERRPPRPARRTKRGETPDHGHGVLGLNAPSEKRPVQGADHADWIGHLARGQELVLVDVAQTALADVFRVLSSTELASRARWIALWGDELVFVFDGEDPVRPAIDLLAVMAGARLAARRATVAQVARIEELVEQARQTSPTVRRTRMGHDAYSVPG